MKKALSVLTLVSAVTLAGCNVQTENNSSGGSVEITDKDTTIEILGMASNENDMNIVRDQLIQNGFKVNLNTQPDFSAFSAQRDAGNYDLAISSWTTVTGNPDYAVRSLFKSDGDYNYSNITDDRVDQLIDEAALQTPDEFTSTYKDLEDALVTENAYIIPLYTSLKGQAFNHNDLDPATIRLSKSRAFAWEPVSFNDTSANESQALVLAQANGELTSLDPIKGNDGSINQLNTNMYVRLVNLTDDDQVVSDGSLSYNHVIAEGNSEYYFVLRDDINFARIEDGEAVDTGELVSGQDVVFSLDRASDPTSVPDHRTYSLHEHIDTVEIVNDLSELEEVNTSAGDGSILDALNDGLDTPISSVVDAATDVDNAAGNYQVIKLTTTTPFPQVLNYLAHQSAGIVSQAQVERINTYDIDSYNVDTDIAYGDQRAVTEGNANFDNHLYASGPYILASKNDYQAVFKKNPAYQADTDNAANISEVIVRFIGDADSQLSALRAGELHLTYGVPETQYEIVEGDENLTLQDMPSNGVTYMLVNTNTEGREVAASADLRKALLYSINQEDINASYNGLKLPAYTTLSPLVDTGNRLVADPEKVEEFYANFLESK